MAGLSAGPETKSRGDVGRQDGDEGDCGQARVRIATERVAPGTQASSRQRSITCSSAAVRVQIWKALTRFAPYGHIGDSRAW